MSWSIDWDAVADAVGTGADVADALAGEDATTTTTTTTTDDDDDDMSPWVMLGIGAASLLTLVVIVKAVQ